MVIIYDKVEKYVVIKDYSFFSPLLWPIIWTHLNLPFVRTWAIFSTARGLRICKQCWLVYNLILMETRLWLCGFSSVNCPSQSYIRIIWAAIFLFFRLFRFFLPTREFFRQIETSPLTMKGSKFWPISTLMVIKQCEFFSMQHLWWHGAYIRNGNFRRSVKFAPNTEHITTIWSCLMDVEFDINF